MKPTTPPQEQRTTRNTTMYTRDPEMALAILFIVGAFVYAGSAIILSEVLYYL